MEEITVEIEGDDIEELDDPEEVKPDYNNSSPLDKHLYSKDARLENAAKFLCNQIDYKLARAVTHMEVVLLNLYWTHHLSPKRWIGASRNNNSYGIPFRYNRQRIEVHPLAKVVEGLLAHGYIIKQRGYFDKDLEEGKCTRIQATLELINLLEKEYSFDIDMIGRHPDEEVIFLKNEDKKLVNYDSDRSTDKMRAFLNQYNEFIQKTYIDIDYMGYAYKRTLSYKQMVFVDKFPTHLHFDMTKKKMKRVFNNDSFKEGGRFYGGFWTEMPSKLRLRLIINCQKVVECDYSGIHIMLLYNEVGIDYALKKEDPYEIPGYPKSEQHRNLFKKLLLSAINAKTKDLARKALQEDINYNPTDFPDETPDLLKVIDDFREHHEPIKNYLCTGEGLRLMYKDSQIAELVMKAMMIKSIPVLPVHDSFICPKQHAEELINIMTRAYKAVTGNKLTHTVYNVNIKEADEWKRSTNPLFEDDGYYYDPSYTEDTDLIAHVLKVEGYPLNSEDDTSLPINNKIVAPHKLYINIPIKYELEQVSQQPLEGGCLTMLR